MSCFFWKKDKNTGDEPVVGDAEWAKYIKSVSVKRLSPTSGCVDADKDPIERRLETLEHDKRVRNLKELTIRRGGVVCDDISARVAGVGFFDTPDVILTDTEAEKFIVIPVDDFWEIAEMGYEQTEGK